MGLILSTVAQILDILFNHVLVFHYCYIRNSHKLSGFSYINLLSHSSVGQKFDMSVIGLKYSVVGL